MKSQFNVFLRWLPSSRRSWFTVCKLGVTALSVLLLWAISPHASAQVYVSIGAGGDAYTRPSTIHTCAVLETGSVKCWGDNADGILGDGQGVFSNSTPQLIRDSSQCSLDIDGNGSIDALTDLLMLARARMGLSGAAVTTNAMGASATRTTWPLIRAYLVNSCKLPGIAP